MGGSSSVLSSHSFSSCNHISFVSRNDNLDLLSSINRCLPSTLQAKFSSEHSSLLVPLSSKQFSWELCLC